MPNQNHVLLLRHCVRSTWSKVEVCDVDAADTNSTNSAKRTAHLSKYLKVPLPEWDVPTKWCTRRGMDIILDLGSYLISDAMNITANTHVAVTIISDTQHRNVDTSLALLKGMKDAIKQYSYSGLDQISINHEVFGHASSWSEKTCPAVSYMDREVYDRVSNKMSRLPPSDFNVQEVLDRIVSLGGFNASIHVENNSSLYDPRCPGVWSLPLSLLDSIGKTTLYSRASHIDPPFLPLASDEDVYKMLYVADYINTLDMLDNKAAAKRGLVLAKSMIGALDHDPSPRTLSGGNNQDRVTITVYLGHHTNINDIATTLGLRWTMPPPYVHGSDDNVGKVVSIPPGSGIIFSPSKENDDDLSMSFVVPVNLIYKNTTNNTNHQMVPIYTIDMEQSELAIRDGRSRNGTIPKSELKRRVEATIVQYPDLRPCYADAPIFFGRSDFQEITPLNTTELLLAAMVVVNLIGCALLLVARRGSKSNQKYEQVQLDKPPEIELC